MIIPIFSKKYGIKEVIIDDNDLSIMDLYTWRVEKRKDTFYVLAHTPMINGKRKTIRLHNVITEFKFVDHIDGNGLNNKKSNLRESNHKLNAQNRIRTIKNKKSKFKGVIKNNQVKSKITWMARIFVNDKLIHLGSFELELDAAKAYNKAAIKYFGEYASLNNLEV